MNASEYGVKHGLTRTQVSRGIRNGTIPARKIRGVWEIDEDPAPGSRLDLKARLTQAQIRKLEQQIDTERQKIRAEAQAELVDDLVSLIKACRVAYRTADLTREQVAALESGFAEALQQVEARREAKA